MQIWSIQRVREGPSWFVARWRRALWREGVIGRYVDVGVFVEGREMGRRVVGG